MAEYEIGIKRLEAKAKEEGLELRVVCMNELFIDLDDTDDLGPFIAKLVAVHKYYGAVTAAYKRRSKSGQGWHIRVIMGWPLEIRERSALHLAVGSDPVRELLRLRSIRMGTEDQQSVFLDSPKFTEELLLRF